MKFEKRFRNAFFYLIDCSFGTLWWIRDSYWMRQLPHFNAHREGHPAVSVRTSRDQTCHATIPMLFGTSCVQSPAFIASGLSSERGNAYKTYFGDCFKPIHTIPRNFSGNKPDIQRNDFKPRLSPEEQVAARKFLQNWRNGK